MAAQRSAALSAMGESGNTPDTHASRTRGHLGGTQVNPMPAQDASLAALRRGMCGGREAGDHEANAEAAKAQCGSAACAKCRSVSCHSVTRADPMPAEGASPPPPHSREADVELCGVSTSGVCMASRRFPHALPDAGLECTRTTEPAQDAWRPPAGSLPEAWPGTGPTFILHGRRPQEAGTGETAPLSLSSSRRGPRRGEGPFGRAALSGSLPGGPGRGAAGGMGPISILIAGLGGPSGRRPNYQADPRGAAGLCQADPLTRSSLHPPGPCLHPQLSVLSTPSLSPSH
ncbi:hypothetical protein H1C71_018786 [Ictidomys tridecemlineatus]|nr:hypothetical protein H1C71_018786 [Ictidomys tridecemlineatus]